MAYESSPDLSTQFGEAILSSDDESEKFIQKMLGFGDTARNWAIVEDGIAVGNVGLAAIERRHATAWAYYWVASSARGRGYAARALSAVADQAFHDGLERLELGHRVNNPASCRVATRAGFVAEGIERQKLRYGTERFDVELHARLHTDPAPTDVQPDFDVGLTDPPSVARSRPGSLAQQVSFDVLERSVRQACHRRAGR